MASDAKEQIRQRLDIAEVIGEVVALKPAGRGQLKGLCPFHSEKTPSFHVHRDRGFFYCFGCQEKGDVFDFVMKTRGMSFAEVLQTLGQRVGVEVSPPGARDRRRNDLYDVNELALGYFTSKLASEEGAVARRYLLERGLEDETITKFGLGFAPDGWDGLLRHGLGKGLRDDDLLAAGLLSENESGRRYDRFRNRVIFPIRDPLGRVVGFAGRVLDDSLPKYLNTPETDIFHKGELLYALDLARNSIRQRNECIVVEGYMDVIALHQAGVEHVVAALGATLTAQQADHLSRLDVQRLYLAFDADSAGQRAVLSGLEQAVGRQFLVRAVQVPFGKDPADAVMSGHLQEFLAALDEGLSEVEFRFNSVIEKHDAKSVAGQKAILNELLPALRPRSVFDPVASEMRRLVIDRLGMDGRALDAWLGSVRGGSRLDDTQVKGMKRRGGTASQTVVIELEIIALLLLEPERLRSRLERVEMALPPAPDSLLREFAELCRECDFDDRQVLLHYRERDEGGVVWSRLFGEAAGDTEGRIDVDGHIEKSLSRLRELYLDSEKSSQQTRLLARMEEIQALLADATLPAERLERLYAELKEIAAKQVAREAERRLRVPAGYLRRRRN
ncbi:MAG TPA: DNA primase [Trueperaceae bacterium]